jgi:hypothetical protein
LTQRFTITAKPCKKHDDLTKCLTDIVTQLEKKKVQYDKAPRRSARSTATKQPRSDYGGRLRARWLRKDERSRKAKKRLTQALKNDELGQKRQLRIPTWKRGRWSDQPRRRRNQEPGKADSRRSAQVGAPSKPEKASPASLRPKGRIAHGCLPSASMPEELVEWCYSK